MADRQHHQSNPEGRSDNTRRSPFRQLETRRRTLDAEFRRLSPQYDDYGQRARELGKLAAQHEQYFNDGNVDQQRQVREEFNRLAAIFRQDYTQTQYANEVRRYSRQAVAHNQDGHQNDHLVILPSHIELMNRAYNGTLLTRVRESEQGRREEKAHE